MDELTPMMSLSTFLAMLFIVLMAGRGIIEYIEYKNRKSAGMGASQKAIQRYFKQKGA